MNSTAIKAALCGMVMVSACDMRAGKQVTEPTEAPSVSLADISNQLQSDTPRIGEVPEVDMAARNINPLRTPENYRQRDVWNGLLAQARQDPDYLNRSMTKTLASLNSLPVSLPYGDYQEVLEDTAAIHASALNGDRTAHEAQAQAFAYIQDGIRLGTIQEYEQAIGERIMLVDFEKRVANFQKRTYLNYFLTLDRLQADYSDEEIAEMANSAAEKLAARDPEQG